MIEDSEIEYSIVLRRLLHHRRPPGRGLPDRPRCRGHPGARAPGRPPARPRRPQQGPDLRMTLPGSWSPAAPASSARTSSARCCGAPGPGRTSEITVSTSSPTRATPPTSTRCAATRGFAFVQRRHLRRRARRRADARTTTRWSTSPPSPMSTAPSTARAEFVRTNVVGTQTLLDAALRRRRAHASCTSPPTRCTARSTRAPGPRTTRWRPTRPTRRPRPPPTCSPCAYHRTHGLDVRVTRCSNNYGPHQFPEKVIPLFVTNLLDGEPVPLYGDGGNVRDWLHVDDHCRGIELVRTKGRAGRGLQHRRRHRADQQGAHRPAAGRLRRRLGHASSTSPTARATTAATRWTAPRSATSSATRRASAFGTGWPRPSRGTATTAPGGSRCAVARS